jgi:hypothetical protein
MQVVSDNGMTFQTTTGLREMPALCERLALPSWPLARVL